MIQKKYILLFCSIVFSFIAYDKVLSPSYPFRYEKVQLNINNLRLGMTSNEVELLIGYPKAEQQFISADKQIKETIWVLHFYSNDTNQIPVLTFNSDNKKLIRIEKLTKNEVIKKLD